jgi:hypothetical protein
MLVPRCKGLRIARIVETSNAESPTLMSIYVPCMTMVIYTKTNEGVYKHPKGRPRCFVFDNPFEVAKFLQRQNQSVQLRLLCICIMPTYHPLRAFSKGYDGTKIHIFTILKKNSIKKLR